MNLDRSFRHAGTFLTVVFLAGCGGGTEPEALILSLVSGGDQTATEGQAVSDDLVVRVTQGGNGVAGTTVSWTVTAGGGSVNPTSSSTDNAGMASTTWTLGPAAGANSVDATASGATGSPATFAATGVVAPPQQAAVSVGDFFFDPTSQRVAVGGTVTWTWVGNVIHNVTFPTGTDNSETQIAGMFDRDFPEAGSFAYQCTIHPSLMNGTVVVE